MTLTKKLVEKLACPACREGLTYREEKNQLTCDKCQLSYRVADDIPVLLVDEADKLE